MFLLTFSNRICLTLFLLLGLASFLTGEENTPALDTAGKQAVISEVSKLLLDNYVNADTARAMSEFVQGRLRDRAYDGSTNPQQFAELVMSDLRSISKDKHLGFFFAPERAAAIRNLEGQDEKQKKAVEDRERAELEINNFGFQKVERMAGNIGYLDFRFFASPEDAGETAIAALNFLSHCSAILIDLRRNGGGHPELIQLMSTYFFRESTHLNDIYTRRSDSTENYWTLPYVPGRRMPEVDLYILTSNRTFSGAEEFTYNMQNLKRATIIGEVTGGGAHPVDGKVVQNDFVLNVPYARAINPISKTNWEGTGVTPDVQVPAEEAFDRAYEMALERLASKAEGGIKQEAEWTLAGLKSKKNPVRLSKSDLAKFAGVYETRRITFENGSLYYQRFGPKLRMTPMSSTLFSLEGVDDFRVEFVIRDSKSVELIGLYSDGTREPSKRAE